jgi:hypothetical protein
MKDGSPPQFRSGFGQFFKGDTRDICNVRRDEGKNARGDEREKSRRKGDEDGNIL